MDRGEKAIYRVAGVDPHLYRAPHGKKTPWELFHARRDNLAAVNWNISTNELRTKDFETVARNIVNKTRPGGIIDLHDGYGNDHGTPQADKSLTVKALPVIIEGLRDKGYSFETIPELLNLPAYNAAAR